METLCLKKEPSFPPAGVRARLGGGGRRKRVCVSRRARFFLKVLTGKGQHLGAYENKAVNQTTFLWFAPGDMEVPKLPSSGAQAGECPACRVICVRNVPSPFRQILL